MSKASQAGGQLEISNSKQIHIALKRNELAEIISANQGEMNSKVVT
jgi:hypothetical protein